MSTNGNGHANGNGKPHCTATTRAGNPCTASPLHGTSLCLAHSPANVRESAGFVADNGKAGRPKNPRAVDVLRERIEQDIDRVLKPLFDGLEAEQGIALSIKGGGMELATLADFDVRIKAARELLDRAYGKPKQTTEISGADGGPVELSTPQDALERSRRAAMLLAANGVIPRDDDA